MKIGLPFFIFASKQKSIAMMGRYLPVGLNHFGNFVVVFAADEVMKLPEPADCCLRFELLL